MAMQVLEFSVDTPAILKEIARNFSGGTDADSPGIVAACNEIRIGLARIAQRAIAINDLPILKELERLGCVNAGGR